MNGEEAPNEKRENGAGKTATALGEEKGDGATESGVAEGYFHGGFLGAGESERDAECEGDFEKAGEVVWGNK